MGSWRFNSLPSLFMADSELTPRSLTLTVDEAFARAVAYHRSGMINDAERFYRAILSVRPGHIESIQKLDALMERRAIDAFSAGRYTEAMSLAEQLAAQPATHAFGLKLLGTVYGRLGSHREALETLGKAAQLLPSDAEIQNSIGVTLIDINRLHDAKEAFLRAVQLDPDYASPYSNLGYVLNALGDRREAIESCRRALDLQPDFAMAMLNLGVALLGEARYSEGWPFYERRDVLESVKVPDLPFPCWRGESLNGRSLLLWPEQGFGDYVQFIRYTSLLKRSGVSRLTVRCSTALKDLLITAPDIDSLIGDADPVPTHDYWTFPLSLPLLFGTTLETIPTELPYLFTVPGRISFWQGRLPRDGLRVGVAWKGNPNLRNDANRSLPSLATLAPLWRVPGVSFVSLQKGAGEEEARSSELPIIDAGSDIRDFADTAAIVEQLDLVICVDTSVAHVAGALGKPCWVLLPAIGCDWRWLRDRSDSPWYPGVMRLFRQKRHGDWDSVIDDVAKALGELAR